MVLSVELSTTRLDLHHLEIILDLHIALGPPRMPREASSLFIPLITRVISPGSSAQYYVMNIYEAPQQVTLK